MVTTLPVPRSFAIPTEVELFWVFDTDSSLKEHARYRAAKAGDWQAAVDLVADVGFQDIWNLRSRFDSGAIFVAPFAREASGDNAIPVVLAAFCAELCGGRVDRDVVQVTKVYHTGADPMERLALRPAFEGDVQLGQPYVLVDDVISLGGTLSELASYIQSKGGVVAGIFVLVNAGRTKSIHPTKSQLRILKERYQHDIKDIFGIEIGTLTANEASYLVGFRTVDEIRNRLVKAKEEVNRRLASKGIPGIFG